MDSNLPRVHSPDGASPITEGLKSSTQVLILLSGGLDSTACVKFYLDLGFRVSALFIDYSHAAARREKAAASAIAVHYGVSLDCISCAGLPQYGEGFILGRNAFLLHCALISFRHRSGLIALGIHSGTAYTDCTPGFLDAVQKIFDIYSCGAIQVAAPFIKWTKEQVFGFSMDRAVPISKTYSCEQGLPDPCGYCLSCKDLERSSCILREARG